MAHSTIQSSLEEETFTRFWGCLVTMFGGHARQSRSSATSSGIDAKTSSLENKLSTNSRQHKINLSVEGVAVIWLFTGVALGLDWYDLMAKGLVMASPCLRYSFIFSL